MKYFYSHFHILTLMHVVLFVVPKVFEPLKFYCNNHNDLLLDLSPKVLQCIKDCLPYLFPGFINKYFNKISLDNMLSFKINRTSFKKMHGFSINMQ